MLDAVILASLRHRALVVAAALLLLGAGGYAALTLPVDVFPDLTAPTVTIVTEAHGMAPVEVETLVTFPIEAAMNGAAGVRRVRSSTAVGISVVWVEFDWGADVFAARQVVAEKLALVAGALPPEVERPVLAPVSSVMGEILFVALTSPRHSGIELRTVADTLVRRRLLSVPGVAQVVPIGGGEKQYQVVLDPARLAAFGVGLGEVADRLGRSNRNVSPGVIVEGGRELLVRGIGRVRDEADVAATVVAVRDGVPVRVGQLGDVRIGAAIKRGEGSARGEPAVVLGILKQPGANTLELTARLDATLDELADALPAGMTIDRRLFRQADFIARAIRNVSHALRDGGLLVVIVVLVFLGNLRASLITLLAIPVSLVAAVLALSALGATFNTMTLGGLTIAIGELVDDAIIDVENVVRRLRENARRPAVERRGTLAVVYGASVEIRSSVVFATLIILLVFLPIFALGGVEGRLLQPLGLAYVVALAASLFVALTLTPALCSILLPVGRGLAEGREPAAVRALKAAYSRGLGACLRHPAWVIAPAAALLVGALVAIPGLGLAFLPEFNEGALTIAAVTLPGTSLAESDALGRAVERTILARPEVTGVARRTGRAELDQHAQGVESAEIDVTFLLPAGRRKSEFLASLREDLSLVPGMSITIGQPIAHRIDHMLSGSRANLAIKVFGDDLGRLRGLAEQVRRAAEGVDGVVDLSVEPQVDVPIARVAFDRAALARHGLDASDLADVVEAAVGGLVVTQVLEGRYAFDLVVRLGDPARLDWRSIGDLPVDTPAGAKIPLKSLARLDLSTGPNQISREGVQRKIVVTCNVAGRDLGGVVEEIRARVDRDLTLGPGERVEYGGQFESAARTTRLLAGLGLAVVVGIALLLMTAFGSLRDALLVMVNLPLALIGGVAGVYLGGGVVSVASLIGFLTLFGIATRNGIMFVSHVRHLRQSGEAVGLAEAVHRGAIERLAPILMTAMTAGLALVPLAIGGDEPGNEIQSPMALVILCGLATSTALNLVVLPTLYLRYGRAELRATEVAPVAAISTPLS